VGDLLVEVDGRDVTNLDVKQVKEMTKGPPGSPMKLKAQRGGSVFEAVLERSGGTGTSMASVSDASSMLGNTSGVVGKELTASERGKEGMEAAVALHEELDRLRASLATMVGELDKTREELKSTEGMQKELANTSSRLAEFTEKASDLQAQLEEANGKLSMTAKSGDERVLALEGSLKETEDSLREQKKMSEKQALDLDEALSALRAVHSAVCKEGPAPVLGGIGIALGTATVSVKGKQKKLVQVTQLATSGPAAKAGVKVGDLLVEVDGRDVTNLDVKQVKELSKGVCLCLCARFRGHVHTLGGNFKCALHTYTTCSSGTVSSPKGCRVTPATASSLHVTLDRGHSSHFGLPLTLTFQKLSLLRVGKRSV
jgi:C-terminal processing protease CtpA/Prc